MAFHKDTEEEWSWWETNKNWALHQAKTETGSNIGVMQIPQHKKATVKSGFSGGKDQQLSKNKWTVYPDKDKSESKTLSKEGNSVSQSIQSHKP